MNSINIAPIWLDHWLDMGLSIWLG